MSICLYRASQNTSSTSSNPEGQDSSMSSSCSIRRHRGYIRRTAWILHFSRSHVTGIPGPACERHARRRARGSNVRDSSCSAPSSYSRSHGWHSIPSIAGGELNKTRKDKRRRGVGVATGWFAKDCSTTTTRGDAVPCIAKNRALALGTHLHLARMHLHHQILSEHLGDSPKQGKPSPLLFHPPGCAEGGR